MMTGSPTVSGRTPGGMPFMGPVPPRAIRIEPLCTGYGKHTVTGFECCSLLTGHKGYDG
ncbi:hypothetical protein Pta02_56170 [Planobispora takensis]|uniref:Uncharacterized protein n=2 Tax=Planobispora TaxID=29298 RepID=A0A8J3WV57_9ACTN|nr:hypothetical protein Psi01_68680 [Planobispora siamensis]GII03609.1 hypothetical protein Pta02_56170 [Planobispora takensis]